MMRSRFVLERQKGKDDDHEVLKNDVTLLEHYERTEHFISGPVSVFSQAIFLPEAAHSFGR